MFTRWLSQYLKSYFHVSVMQVRLLSGRNVSGEVFARYNKPSLKREGFLDPFLSPLEARASCSLSMQPPSYNFRIIVVKYCRRSYEDSRKYYLKKIWAEKWWNGLEQVLDLLAFSSWCFNFLVNSLSFRKPRIQRVPWRAKHEKLCFPSCESRFSVYAFDWRIIEVITNQMGEGPF